MKTMFIGGPLDGQEWIAEPQPTQIHGVIYWPRHVIVGAAGWSRVVMALDTMPLSEALERLKVILLERYIAEGIDHED
jgi:hypothetical protein